MITSSSTSAASVDDATLPAIQLCFESFAPFFRPFLTVPEVRFLFDDCSESHVVEMIECGRLRALNVALSLSTRRSLRIFRHSVDRILIPSLRRLRGEPKLEALLPHLRPSFLAREIADLLPCAVEHVRHLVSSDVLTGANVRVCASDRGRRMPRIDRGSLLAFLHSREVLS